jgi:hypothetical protein
MRDEPVDTLVEKKLYTSECMNFVRSEIYNALYHEGPKSVAELVRIIDARIKNGMVGLPHIHGAVRQIELVEIAEHAIYKSSFGSGAEWKPDTTSFDVTEQDWLTGQLTARCNNYLTLLLMWALRQHRDALIDIISKTNGLTASATLFTDKDDELRAQINKSQVRTSERGEEYYFDHGSHSWTWGAFSKAYSLWLYMPGRLIKDT